MTRRRRVADRAGDLAVVLDRVAALVGAGLPPGTAWTTVVARDPVLRDALGPDGASPPTGSAVVRGLGDTAARRRAAAPGRAADRGRAAARTGVRPGDAGSGTAWSDVAAVVDVAERAGAAMAPALRILARAVRETAAADRAVHVALAGPRASARVVLALPVFGLLLGSAWGAGAVTSLVSTPFGWACCAAATALVLAGSAWSRRLVHAAEPPDRIPGAWLVAWSVAVSGGGSLIAAEGVVTAAWTDDQPGAVERARLADALALSRAAGVPVAGLLEAAAEDVRRDAAAAGLAAAERLGVRLVLPLGICVLPAFVLVGVVPVVIGVLSSTVGVLS